MLTFEPFRIWFITKHPTKKKGDLVAETGLSSPTLSKVRKDEFPVNASLILTLCATYNLDIHEVIRRKQDPNPIDYTDVNIDEIYHKQNATLTFTPFRVWFITKHPTKRKGDVPIEANIGSENIATKIWNDNTRVTTNVIEKLCTTYDLKVHEVIGIKRDTSTQ